MANVEECDATYLSVEFVKLFRNAIQGYTFSLHQNNSLLYTHVERNSCMGIMKSLVSSNVGTKACVEVQKFAKHVVSIGNGIKD